MAYDFPNSPSLGQVANGYVWDGEKWKGAGALPGPVFATKKNYIINGAMQISQENGTTASPAIGNYFPADQWWTEVSTGGNVHTGQVAKATPAGSPNRLRVSIGVADTSVGTGDRVQIIHRIEGLRIADLRFGSAQAKTVTLQFGVYAPAGTYCVSLANGAANRIYAVECVISAGEANTDIVKTITIPGDITGTWVVDNTLGFDIRWMLMAGTTFQGAILNAWAGGNALATTNQFNIAGSTSNVFELFDVSLTEGSVAPPFQVPDYASELALCQRYWQFGFVAWDGWITAGQTLVSMMVDFKVTMRSTPSVFFINGVATGVVAAATAPQILVDGMEVRHTTAAAGVAAFMDTWKVSARL